MSALLISTFTPISRRDASLWELLQHHVPLLRPATTRTGDRDFCTSPEDVRRRPAGQFHFLSRAEPALGLVYISATGYRRSRQGVAHRVTRTCLNSVNMSTRGRRCMNRTRIRRNRKALKRDRLQTKSVLVSDSLTSVYWKAVIYSNGVVISPCTRTRVEDVKSWVAMREDFIVYTWEVLYLEQYYA